MFVDGEWRAAHSRAQIELIDPSTERWIAGAADGDTHDVAAAASAARAAAPDWGRTAPEERAALLDALADAVDKRQDEIARLVTAQNGTVLSRSRRTNGTRPVALYRHFADVARSFHPERYDGEAQGIIRREPLGVVGIIVPWNAPQSLLANKIGPALAAGCTAVIKPAAETSLDALLLAQMASAEGFPPGVINVVTGGRRTGAALVDCNDVDMVSFTGSTSAGRQIAARCGHMLRPLLAELGGKSAAVLLDDADLDVFAAKLIATCLPNTGQVCYACTRIIAPRALFDDVVDVVTHVLSQARVGDPLDPGVDFGPLVSEAQRRRVEQYIATARADGATVAFGGDRPPDTTAGYYVQPTVLVDVDRSMPVFREEIFGPVVVVVAHDGDDDAVTIANDSSYGLGGAVFSRDHGRAIEVARHTQTGGMSINGADRGASAPFYGYKDSGLGGVPGLEAHLAYKFIADAANAKRNVRA
ncbi:aldehyde dehydrogenase [Mycolicibacterium goodii]|uniref:Aldehyde dehydrogenase n=2 Tax=Mycolicibacterium goodii TaxID=134601 RepID=A0A0K0XGG0_MYCGD|nr:aldehyde dehydrogenase [Mycolicibacterium goodii]